MQRQGADLTNMATTDFICDFSRREWDGKFPLVEGHQGALISGDCLTLAFGQVVLEEQTSLDPGYTCTMCLEERKDRCWQSPAYEDAIICLRCIRQGSTKLHKDPDWDWTKPTLQEPA
ncbi:MAG: hypothetical protein COB69_03610 [Phycisphaera sp.]|nr:MAG: hypothetical protein COB69_03610 [Phycisphaera sp.]